MLPLRAPSSPTESAVRARGRDKDGVQKLRKTSYHLSLCISPDGGRE